MSRPMKIVTLVVLLIVAGVFSLLFIWPPINHVVTGQTAQYPDIQPQAYRMSQTRTAHTVVDAIEALDRFTLVSADIEAADIHAEVTTRSGRYTDDLHVWVEANGEGGAVVFMESSSRRGRADFGQNARTIRALFAELDERIGQ